MTQVTARAVRLHVALNLDDRAQRIVLLPAQVRDGGGEVIEPVVQRNEPTVDIQLVGGALGGESFFQIVQLRLGDVVVWWCRNRCRGLNGVDAHASLPPAVERPAADAKGDGDDGDKADEANDSHEDEGFGHISPWWRDGLKTSYRCLRELAIGIHPIHRSSATRLASSKKQTCRVELESTSARHL